MGLFDIKNPDSVLEAIGECERLGRNAFLRKFRFAKAREYFVWHNGRPYDSKAIAGVAHGYEFPSKGPLRASDFSGGETTVARKLGELGFDVRQLALQRIFYRRSGSNASRFFLCERYAM